MKSNDETSISDAPAAPEIDASQLDAFARAHNMAYQWRTSREDGRWRGDVRLGETVKTMIWWVERADDEQAALDKAIANSISYHAGRGWAVPASQSWDMPPTG